MKLRAILEFNSSMMNFAASGGYFPNSIDKPVEKQPSSVHSYDSKVICAAMEAGDSGIILKDLPYEKDNIVKNLITANLIKKDGDRIYITDMGKKYWQEYYSSPDFTGSVNIFHPVQREI